MSVVVSVSVVVSIVSICLCCSVYFMRESMLLTNDLDIIKEVFLKDFSNFTERVKSSLYTLGTVLANDLKK